MVNIQVIFSEEYFLLINPFLIFFFFFLAIDNNIPLAKANTYILSIT